MNIVLTTKTLSEPERAGRISTTMGLTPGTTNESASGKLIHRRCSSADQNGEGVSPGGVNRRAVEDRNAVQRR
jgi:hypothetical protein